LCTEALDGLEAFSHVWLTFQFHMNTNVLKEAKAFNGVQTSNRKFTFTAKITPPVSTWRLNILHMHLIIRPLYSLLILSLLFSLFCTYQMLKRKVGVLSTRSPHRPNAIGVTLARIERVDKGQRCLHLSACDLVHGTPILDIKVSVCQQQCHARPCKPYVD
jgi:tRNA (adenine37-N6)-methyltransferase